MSKIYLSSKGFKPEDTGSVKILNRQLETAKDKDALIFPEGIFYLMDSLRLHNKALYLEGGENTELRFYGEGVGLLMTRDQGGNRTHINNLQFRNVNSKGGAGNHGVEISVPCTLENCWIRDFMGWNLNMWASIGGERPVSQVAHNKVSSCLISGGGLGNIRIQGADASVINFYHCDVRDTPGYNVYDASMFGCSHFGTMAHNGGKGNFWVTSPVGSAGLYGCYSESGSLNYFGGGATVFGGMFLQDQIILQGYASYYTTRVITAPFNTELLKS